MTSPKICHILLLSAASSMKRDGTAIRRKGKARQNDCPHLGICHLQLRSTHVLWALCERNYYSMSDIGLRPLLAFDVRFFLLFFFEGRSLRAAMKLRRGARLVCQRVFLRPDPSSLACDAWRVSRVCFLTCTRMKVWHSGRF